MPQVANNADDWAEARQNIFFTASDDGTSRDGNLTGQCVTETKWFLAEMTDVPDPFSARGDARYVGKKLVEQGHAYEVPYSERQRGDIVCLENGKYGHIYNQLSNRRTFEENVNLGGVDKRLIKSGGESWYVYASRIGSDTESWRKDMHVYRVYSYKEKGDSADMNLQSKEQVDSVYVEIMNRHATDEEQKHGLTVEFWTLWVALNNAANEERNNIRRLLDLGIQANKDEWDPGKPADGFKEVGNINGETIYEKDKK